MKLSDFLAAYEEIYRKRFISHELSDSEAETKKKELQALYLATPEAEI